MCLGDPLIDSMLLRRLCRLKIWFKKEDLFSYSDLLTKSVVPVLYDFRVSISLLRKTSKLQDMSQK